MNTDTVIDPNKQIQSILKIVKAIEDCHKKFANVSQDWCIVKSVTKLKESLKKLETKCTIIEEKIKRPETKIFFFGRISVGKSRIINAIFGTDLLVSVSSHSTCCFVHMKKSKNSKWSINYRDRKEEFNDFHNVKSKLRDLTSCHDLNNRNNLNFDESVECFVVCNDDNKIFKDNTEIVDCPGSENKQDITKSIKQHSLDADIFVFVVMASITDNDRLFFDFQYDQSTKPDIFILVNACDIGDKDDENENIKSIATIKEQCRNFLQKNYDEDEDEDINKRIFMISADEMLNIRMNKKRKKNTEKREERRKEFENFENIMASYIANPIKNKLRRYNKDILSLSDEVEKSFETFSKNINDQKNDSLLEKYRKKKDALGLLEKKICKNCENFTLNMDGHLTNMIDIVDLFNLDVVNNEIKNRYKTFDEQILRFAASQGDEISDFLKTENLDKSFKHNWKDKMKTLWDEGDKIKSLLKTDENSTSKTVARWLSWVPVGSIIATNIAISRSYEVDENNENFRKQYIEELKEELNELNKKKMKIIENNTNIIEQEIHSNIISINTIFDDKMNAFNDYWSTVNILLKSRQNQ